MKLPVDIEIIVHRHNGTFFFAVTYNADRRVTGRLITTTELPAEEVLKEIGRHIDRDLEEQPKKSDIASM